MRSSWIMLLLYVLGPISLAQAGPSTYPVQARPGYDDNVTRSPIRRINPNSRQGTVPSNPAQRDGLQSQPRGRPPTLENRGIGNGQRFPAPAPSPGKPPGQR